MSEGQKGREEAARLAALRSLQILDTPPEEAFDRITRLVGKFLKTPIALVSLVDQHRLWFKSHYGVGLTEVPRAGSFCTQAIRGDDVYVVPDAKVHKRFSAYPWVTGPPGVRFYAGMPLKVPSGRTVGTLCAVDMVPRELTASELEALRDLGALVVDALAVRQAAATDHQRLEGRFDALFELSPEGSLLVNGQGIITRANPRAETLFGYAPGQMLGLGVEQLLPLSAKDGLLSLRQEEGRGRASRHTAPERPVMQGGRRDGSHFPVDISLSRLPAKEGVQMLVAVRDITLRRQAEEELRRSEARLNEAQRIAQVGNWEHDLLSGRVVWSAEMFRIMELDERTAVPSHETFLQNVHPEDRQRIEAELQRLPSSTQPVDAVYRLFTQEGRVKQVRARKSVEVAADGTPVRLAGTVQDVTERVAVEQELGQQRNLLQTVMDTVPDILFLKDLEGRYLLVNRAMAQFFGQPEDWYIGKTNVDLPNQPPEFHSISVANDQKVLETSRPVASCETRMIDAAGVEHWRLATKLPWRDTQGRLVGMVGMNRDITDRKQAEQELQRQRNLLQTVMDTVPDIFFLKNLRGEYLLANRAMAQFFGRPEAWFVGKTNDDLPNQGAGFFDLAQTQDRELLESSSQATTREALMVDAGGTRQWRLATKLPWRDAEGHLVGVVGMNRDITERKEAEQKLERQRNQLQALMDTIPDMIYLKDGRGHYSMVNRAMGDFYGRPQEWFVGRDATDLGSNLAESIAVVEETDRQILSGALPAVSLEVMAVSAQGRRCWLMVTKVPWLDGQGRLAGLVGVNRDITERKVAQQELERQRNLLQTIMDTVPDMIYLKDREGRFRLVNRAAADYYGHLPEWFIGKRTQEVWDPSLPAVPQIVEQDQQILTGAVPAVHSELLTMGAAGQSTWRSVTKLPWLDAQGRVQGLVGVNRDITARKEAERALETQRRLLQDILDALPDLVFLKDRRSQYVMVNQAMAKFIGKPPEWFIGKGLADLGEQVAESRAVIAQADQELLRGQRRSFSHEVRSLTRDGEARWSLRTTVPLRDAEGAVAGLVGISRDITERKEVERELMEGRGLLQTIMDTVPEWLYLKDRAGRYHLVNRAMAEFLGRQPEWFIGKGPQDLALHPDDSSQSAEMDREILEQGRPVVTREVLTSTPDGQRNRWLLATKLPWRDAQGHIVGVVGINQDITERRNAEQALRDSEERFRVLIENALDIITVLEADGTIRYESPSIKNLLGYEPGEIVGHNVLEFCHPDDVPRAAQELAQGVREPGSTRFVTLRFRDKANNWHDLEVIGRNLLDDPTMHGIVINSRDVTDRKRAEELNIRLGRIVENSTNEIFIFDLKTLKFQLVNSGARENLGYTMENLLEMTPIDINPEFTAESFEDFIAPLKDGTRYRIIHQTVHRRKDGTTYPVEMRLQISKMESPPVFVAVIEDITDRKSLESQLRQSQKMEAVGRLSGGIAHDFNNMLQIIEGYTLLAMNDHNHPESLPGYLEHVMQAARRAADLTRQLLAFSRQHVLNRTSVPLGPLVQNVARMGNRLVGAHIELTVQVGEENPVVDGDPTMLEQVLVNLCVNAKDAMPNGGQLLLSVESLLADATFCSLHEWARPGRYGVISVSDTGVGMSEAVRQRIFEPFFTTKEVGQGTGLGLSMAYGIVRQHQGGIEVTSEPGQGSTFRVYIPEAQTAAQPDAVAVQEPAAGGRETLLLAEDEPDVRSFVAMVLRDQGYQVLEAVDGEQALALHDAHHESIRLAILDMLMPRRDGRSTFEQLRRRDPDLRVLFTTGYSGDDVDSSFADENGVPTLHKPYGPHDLLRAVREALA